MPTFNDNFGFKESPFDLYVAEREPKIDEYAVRPPYFEETRRRIAGVSSYILFGFRGSGKSATRITAEKDAWKAFSEGAKSPLLVSMIDFDSILKDTAVADVVLHDIVTRVAFLSIEALLLWISNQREKEKIVDLLDEDELKAFVLAVKAYYLSVPEQERALSQEDTMKILQQNWINVSKDWIDRKWNGIANIIGILTSAVASNKLGSSDMSKDVAALLSRDKSPQSCRSTLSKIVELVRIFGFSGVCVFVDKVDEHTKTQRSSDETTRLIHPVLSQVQFMEIDGFAWIFFLWDKVKAKLSSEGLSARLDKFAHSEVSWSKDFLQIMIEKRLDYYSEKKFSKLDGMCENPSDASRYLDDIISLVQSSPRELVRLLDVITREFNSSYAHLTDVRKLVEADFEAGKDSYVRDVLWTVYENKTLSQLLRFNKKSFTNKDVQQAFKISPAGARGRIQSWEACGAVSLSGTRASEGDAGGKPANEYSIVDPRIMRMADRGLFDPDKLSEAPLGGEEEV